MADSSIGLTVFLIRDDQVSAFEKDFPPSNGLPISAAGLDGWFTSFPSSSRTPAWVTELASILTAPIAAGSLDSRSPAGILAIRNGGRLFALTFGHAWQRLEDDWLERDFGRRVVLNALGSDQFLELRTEQVFGKWHLTSDRSPHATSVDQFGVRFDRDLVAVVEGATDKKYQELLGKTIRGGTSLRITAELHQLEDVLRKCAALFGSRRYRKTLPHIDNLLPIGDSGLKMQLEAKLDQELITPDGQKRIVMFTPMQRRGESIEVKSYVYGRLLETAAKRPYITTTSWINSLKGVTPSVDIARASKIHMLLDDGDESRSCTAFDCLSGEVSYKGKPYVLSSGVWYEVSDDFLTRVNTFIRKIPKPQVSPVAWNKKESEGEYNIRSCKNPDFMYFDAKNIMYGGGQSKFEFCDMMHLKSRTLVFAKIVSRSSGMSHLVEQVRNTASLFFQLDGSYRSALRQKFVSIYPEESAVWLDTKPRAGDWNFCLASLGAAAAEMPLFARISLMQLVTDLRDRGHEVTFIAV